MDTDDIDQQIEDRKPRRDNYTRTSNGDGMHRRVLEALIGVAVVSLVAAVWNLTQTVTLLQATQTSHQRDIDRMERRQDSLEGKMTRGGPDALNKQ